MKKVLKSFLGICISIVFLYMTFRKLDISEIFATIAQADLSYLCLAICIALLGMVVRSYRWKLLGRNFAKVRWFSFFKATNIGLMLNIVLPFRSGDFFQCYVLSKDSDLPKSYVLSTVFLERFIDFFVTVTVIMVSSFYFVMPDEIRISGTIWILVIFLLLIYCLVCFHDPIKKFLTKILGKSHHHRLEEILGNVVVALDFLNSRQVIQLAIPLSFINLMAIYGSSTYFVLKALDIHIGFYGALLVMAITLLSAAIPSSPGQLGTWEYFCIIGLSIFNVDRQLAASYAVVGHAVALLPTLVVGGYFCLQEFLVKKNLSFKQVNS